MGGVTSVGAAIFVQLDNVGAIIGGGQISGRVYLSVEKDNVTADSLNVKFFGREATRVQYTVQNGDNTETRYAYDERVIVCMDCVLAIFPKVVSRGRYEFPFAMKIPFGLPGKQGTRSGSEWFVTEYFLEARLHRYGMFAWDVHNHQEIFLLDPPSPIKIPSFVPPVTKPIYFCCCIDKGTVTVLANCDDTNINSGELFNVDYSVHNESEATIKALEIRIDQTMRYTADGHVNHVSSVMFHKRVDQSELEGIDKMPRHGNGVVPVDYATIFQQLMAQTKRASFNFPNCRSTMRGQLGTVQHALVVRVATPFCVDDPEIHIPLTVINGPQVAFQGMVPAVGATYQRPADWNAMVAPPVMLHGAITAFDSSKGPPPPGMIQQPGMMQPGMMQPGMMQPGMMQPGMMQPGMMQPGMMQPGMMQPGMQPGMMQPGMQPMPVMAQPQQPNYGAAPQAAGYQQVPPSAQQVPGYAPIPAVAGPPPSSVPASAGAPPTTNAPSGAAPYPGAVAYPTGANPGQQVGETHAPQPTEASVPSLIQMLQMGNQFTEAEILTEWIAVNDVRKISPEQMTQIFQTIRGEYSYVSFPEQIGKSFKNSLTVRHVAGAVRAVPESMKGRVCTTFAQFVCDKENAREEFAKPEVGLSQHSLLVVYMYYKV